MTEPNSNRIEDIATKQQALSEMLSQVNRDGLLVLSPENFSWLTSGAQYPAIIESNEQPALFFQSGTARWVLCSNVDTNWIFAEELSELGFQLKEWPWYWGRKPLLNDLCQGKQLASDTPFGECLDVGDSLRSMRRNLTQQEVFRLRDVGKAVAHAIEATGRNFERGESEVEIAGQLAHRIVHRGLDPVCISVAADCRQRQYRRLRPTDSQVNSTCVLQATARRHGLHATASRVVSFGEPDELTRKEMETACRWSAVMIAASAPGMKTADAITHGIRYLQTADFEHEWRLAPLGWITGYLASELEFRPEKQGTFEIGLAVVWLANVGAVTNADTIIIGTDGVETVTPAEYWPIKRIKVAGLTIDRPDVLIREE